MPIFSGGGCRFSTVFLPNMPCPSSKITRSYSLGFMRRFSACNLPFVIDAHSAFTFW